MTQNNPYLIENKKPVETVYELKNEFLSFEEFMKNYEYDGKVSNSYQTEINSQERGYGPCKNSSCDCYCPADSCICDNYGGYDHGGHSKRYIKIDKKTSIRGFQHLIHTGNDWADKNGGPSTFRGEMWDESVSVSVSSEVGLHSVRSSAGVNAGVGGVIASGGADYSAIRVSDGKSELNFLSGTIGGEAGFGPGGATLGYTLGADVASVRAGGFSANVGYDAGSGVAIGFGGVEAKVAGVGVSIGKKMGVSTPFGGVSVDLEEACVIQ